MRIGITSNYRNKINSCVDAIFNFELSIKELTERYKERSFRDSKISKEQTFIELLSCEISEETKTFLEQRCGNLSHFRDRRKGYEYGIDLMLGWMIEDALIIFLKNNNIDARLNGTDLEREFLKSNQISSDSDIYLSGKAQRNLELFCDWKGTWSKWNHADFRDNKFVKMKKTKALILGISPTDSKGFLIDMNNEDQVFKFNNSIKGYGGKSGYTIENIKPHLIQMNEIKRKLIELAN